MFLHVLGIFFTSALICSAAPTSEKEHCGKPGQIEGATLQGVWTAETYSPGSVATFTCLHGNIRDGPIKMACIEGSWLDISRGQCKILGQCSKPQQSHENGELEGQWNDETFPPGKIATYICRQGYSQTNPIKMACVEGEWIHISKGQCVAEIVCYQETVKYGNVKYTKETYRDGETVELTCIEGYQIEHNPEELRKCTLHGWSPPLKCISKRCDKPIVLNGYIDSWYSFPVSAGRSVYSLCNSGFLTSTKGGYETITCTKNGWDREPKCFKKCNSPSESSMNAFITHTTSPYIEGEKLRFQCYRDYATLDRQQTGEITCLPDGKFYAEKCHKNSCGKPEEIENGKPRDGRKDYKHAESAAYECFRGYKLSESEAAVCLYGKWVRIPKCIYSSCGPPRKISNGEIRGQEKNTYLTGEKVFYDCVRGFTVGNNENFITCENAAWTEPPECRRIGQSCGAPPVVQNGDVTDLKRLSYLSGSIVKYKCANFYKLEGKETITCTDGEWEKEPICRVPCTIREIDMQENNIRFKHRDDKKLYTEHSDSMSFVCISGYLISDEKRLRIQCLDGVLKFPKCLKEGFCVLQQTEMSRNNIHYNKSNEIENGQTIEFECVEGLVPEKGLKQTCMNKRITYPKCSTGQPCLPPKISNALISPKKEDGYESGSSIDIKCEDTHVLNGQISVKCHNGKWDELPQCFKPCTISTRDLDKNHIEMKPSENPPEIPEHGTEVNVKCKANFKRPGSLIALCYDGIMKYPKCFSGDFCRINQQSLDDNFLDLDKKHDNEVFYEAGETVSFKCKAGYSNRTGLTGTCTKPDKEANYGLTYPVCT